MITIGLVTCNRLHLLRQCVENVLVGTNSVERISVWDNASTDGTSEYLDTLTDERITVTHSATNIGTNAYARLFADAKTDYLAEMDDDIIDAPTGWDAAMVDAMRAVPSLGYLAANIIDDGHSIASNTLYRKQAHLYTHTIVNGVRLMLGPAGGWCTLTPRSLYAQVGGFRENPEQAFWYEDGDYASRVVAAGYQMAILESLQVFHASGPYYSQPALAEDAKRQYYDSQAKRKAAKRLIARLPFAPQLMRLLRLMRR